MVRVYLMLVMYVVVRGEVRGPHHPRGERVIKHHVHYKPSRGGPGEKITQNEHLLHDMAHIQEHLDDVVEETDLSNLSDEELEFYYFQLHDTDKNSKLDGLEILQAIFHTSHHKSDENQRVDHQIDSTEIGGDFEYFVELIDRVLAEDDKDNDGYLSYPEFVAGGKKDGDKLQPVVKMIK